MKTKNPQHTPVYLFDLDNTLIDTQASILGIDDKDNVLMMVSAKAFAQREIQKLPEIFPQLNMHWDFSNFHDEIMLYSEPFLETFGVLRKNHNTSPCYICTSRGIDPWVIMDWLGEHAAWGVKKVFTMYQSEYDEPVILKRETLRQLREMYPDREIIVYEDSQYYIDAMRENNCDNVTFIKT